MTEELGAPQTPGISEHGGTGNQEPAIGLQVSQSADELCDIGTRFFMERRADVARLYFDAALLKEPDHPRALHNLSSSLIQGNLLHAAESVARRALKLGNPDHPGVLMNLTAALNGLGRFDEVIEGTDQILREMPSTDPRLPSVWHNRGLVLNHLQRLDEAIEAYNKALILTNSPEQRNMVLSDRALAILSQGRVVEGCREYKVRWANRLYKSKVWELGVPEWQGEDLQGKKLILQHEQGFGDGIMLVRLVPKLLELGAQVVLAVPGPLVELFTSHVPWSGVPVYEWNEDEDAMRELGADYQVPMLSALGLLGHSPSTIESTPYLQAQADQGNLGPAGFRVGLCWASGYHSFALAIRRRYVPLHLFFPLAEIPGVRLVSLQKDEPSKDILNMGAESFIHDAMARCGDFADTARVIAGLDLVISVDSAVVHLAGALGVPCLMLGPYVRCWRWWNEVTGWPWYKDFEILKQSEWGKWDKEMGQVMELVADAAANRRGVQEAA